MIYKLSKLMAALPLLILTGCAAMMPDLVQMVSEIEDTAICVEVNRDAMQQDTDLHVVVDVINKDPPKASIAKQ